MAGLPRLEVFIPIGCRENPGKCGVQWRRRESNPRNVPAAAVLSRCSRATTRPRLFTASGKSSLRSIDAERFGWDGCPLQGPAQPLRLWMVRRKLFELWLPRMSVAVTTRS